MLSNDAVVRLLAFIGTTFGVVAASDQAITEPKIWMAGIAAGCGAVLAIMRAVGQSATPQQQTRLPPPEAGKG